MSTVLDRFEITELLHRHQIVIDLQDADAYASLFAADGRYRSPFGASQGHRRDQEHVPRPTRRRLHQGQEALHRPNLSRGRRTKHELR
jgi:hypothetical protein